MLRRLLDRLDRYGLDDPDANEGQIEDRCPVCGRPMINHPGHALWIARMVGPVAPAKWPHRRAAAVALLLD